MLPSRLKCRLPCLQVRERFKNNSSGKIHFFLIFSLPTFVNISHLFSFDIFAHLVRIKKKTKKRSLSYQYILIFHLIIAPLKKNNNHTKNIYNKNSAVRFDPIPRKSYEETQTIWTFATRHSRRAFCFKKKRPPSRYPSSPRSLSPNKRNKNLHGFLFFRTLSLFIIFH